MRLIDGVPIPEPKDCDQQIASRELVIARAQALDAIRDLCRDPAVWQTHGMPNTDKLERIHARIERAVLRGAELIGGAK